MAGWMRKWFPVLVIASGLVLFMFIVKWDTRTVPVMYHSTKSHAAHSGRPSDDSSERQVDTVVSEDERMEREFDETQRQRRKWLAESCEKISGSRRKPTKTLLRHLLVNDKQKLLFCFIPKVACTSWKALFIKLSGKVDNNTKLTSTFIHKTNQILRTLSRYYPKSVRRKLGSYKTFIFVREPFERILSAYLNKFTIANSNRDFHLRYGRTIIRLFRTNASVSSLRRGDDVTFPEFVKFLLLALGRRGGSEVNEHWDRYNSLCEPCFMNYDFIGKYETIDVDAPMILKKLGIGNLVNFPLHASKTSSLISKYFSQVNKNDLQKLWSLYRKDYLLWNYPKPSFLQDDT